MFCEQFSVQYEKNIYKKPLHTRFAKLKQKKCKPYSGTKKRKGMKVRLKPEKTNKGFNVNL